MQVAARARQDLIRDGQAAASTGPDLSSRVQAAAQILDEFATCRDANMSDRALAVMAREAVSRRANSGACVAALNVAFNAMTMCLQGPVGVVMAAAGLDMMEATSNPGDQRALGAGILDAIAKTSTSQCESVLAATARAACSQPLAHETGAAAQKEALKLIALAEPTNTTEGLLAQWGKNAASVSKTSANARAIGYEVLKAMGEKATKPAFQALGKAAYDASGEELTHDTGRNAQLQAYEVVLANFDQPPAQTVAEYGRRVSEMPAIELETARLGKSVLGAIGVHAMNNAEQIVAATAHNVSSSRHSDYDSITVNNASFAHLARSVDVGAVQALADYGLLITAATRDSENARSMGSVVLNNIETVAEDADHKKWARKAQSPSLVRSIFNRGDKDKLYVETQREGFQKLLGSRTTLQQARDEKNMDELERMRDALQPKPEKSADVKVDDSTVTIGGIKIDRKKRETPQPAAESGDQAQA